MKTSSHANARLGHLTSRVLPFETLVEKSLVTFSVPSLSLESACFASLKRTRNISVRARLFRLIS